MISDAQKALKIFDRGAYGCGTLGSDYNFGLEQIETIRSALEKADKVDELVKALEYCAIDPAEMHLLQNMQHIKAREALSKYRNEG